VTRYLADTNVVSTTSPIAAPGCAAIAEWMDLHSADLFLSAVTIAEIADGIAKLKREGAKRKTADLAAWLRTVLHLYADRVLAFDSATAEIAGTPIWHVDAAVIEPFRGFPMGKPDRRRRVRQ
jgi:predicted nucleic acid-binding protein